MLYAICKIILIIFPDFNMAEQQIRDLKQKLAEREAEFENYKIQCKQLETLLESQSTKKEEQIRKLKQQAILRQKSFGPLKTQVVQLETENTRLKDQLNQLKSQLANSQSSSQITQAITKEKEQLQKKITELQLERDSSEAKIISLQKKIEELSKNKGKPDGGDSKKLEEAVATSKSKIAELQKQNQKLKQELNKKHSIKQAKNEEKKTEKDHDNKEEQKLREKIEKLQKKLAQSQSEVSKLEEKNGKLSKQHKQLKQKLSFAESEREGLVKKVKQLSLSNSNRKQQVVRQNEEEMESQAFLQDSKDQNFSMASNSLIYSALVLTKKHYASPFLEIKNDNSVRVFKSTKNGCFEKSLGSLKFKLNQISYSQEQLIDGCAKRIKQNINNGIKNSVIFFGSKKTTKKYLLSSLISQLKDFIMQKISQSEEQPEILFVKASPDQQDRIELIGRNPEQIEEILARVVELAKKSPKKPDSKKKPPKPKARYLKISQGQLYLEIITTSFTNIYLRENLSFSDALNNIAYSRLPNALQPINCFRQFIFTLNPIVSLYEDCKNTLSIINCKKNTESESLPEHGVKSSPNKDQLNDFARRKLQNIEREGEQSQLKIRKQEEEIFFYRNKFDELQLRLKNLLNTHREQNSYLKKSPVTLSYQKMLKFVHSVQAKNSSLNSYGSGSKVQQNYGEEVENEHDNLENDEGEGEDIL